MGLQHVSWCALLETIQVIEIIGTPKKWLFMVVDQGLTKELSKYHWVKSLITKRDIVYESLTYSSELYVSARLIWKNDRCRSKNKQFDRKDLSNDFSRSFYSKWNI
ncbi:hypothetical protein Ccrd_010824 [Cynara cardunculus var. scolymus]|uniref:Uncharacterized protein n=1 Tax=Cynara cardunculus var. scolymus TaxID=59895 RepID=A0A103YKE0_CYNCS|nr:hypothetical protein Ccrd_010824 [Cynara cardunculus var. scolymus]